MVNENYSFMKDIMNSCYNNKLDMYKYGEKAIKKTKSIPTFIFAHSILNLIKVISPININTALK